MAGHASRAQDWAKKLNRRHVQVRLVKGGKTVVRSAVVTAYTTGTISWKIKESGETGTTYVAWNPAARTTWTSKYNTP